MQKYAKFAKQKKNQSRNNSPFVTNRHFNLHIYMKNFIFARNFVIIY